MNGKRVMIITLTAIAVIFGGTVLAQDELESLRGMTPIEDLSTIPETKSRQKDHKLIARNFFQQPPLIPHSTKGYQINMKFNKCLNCHSWARYEKSGATKISQTHFKDRDGNYLANVSPSLYFCTQCHVEQLDVEPLVENEFEAVKVLQ